MKTKLIVLSAVALSVFQSCKNDDGNPAPIHDHDGIEELVLQRTDLDGSNVVTYEFEDGDIAGDQIMIEANKEYLFTITELNAHHDGEHENILGEILEEKDEHFFVYQTDTSLNFTRVDDESTTSSTGDMLGVKVRLSADDAQTGVLQIILKHQPSSVDALANGGLGEATGGATDVDAIFPLIIQ